MPDIDNAKPTTTESDEIDAVSSLFGTPSHKDKIVSPDSDKSKKSSRWILRSFLIGLVAGNVAAYYVQQISVLLYQALGWDLALELSGLLAGLPLYLILFIFPSYRKSIRQSDNKIWFVVRSLIFFSIGCLVVANFAMIAGGLAMGA